MRRSALATAAVIVAVVFTSSTPAQAADQTAIKRAIVTTVLNNLGVQPTDQLVNQIVGDIPMDILDSTLIREVGSAIDNSGDPTLIISQTVDSDGDGIPNADATVDSDDEGDDETIDEADGETIDETAENDNDEDKDDDDDEDEDKDDDEDEDDDGHDGDD
jgi:hypothetical protein